MSSPENRSAGFEPSEEGGEFTGSRNNARGCLRWAVELPAVANGTTEDDAMRAELIIVACSVGEDEFLCGGACKAGCAMQFSLGPTGRVETKIKPLTTSQGTTDLSVCRGA
jgi:hypothetical protein